MEKRENYSRKRMAILNLLRETDTHPTAEWVYEQLRPKYPDLSLGTVYRNLKTLCQKGRAMSVGVLGGQEHFDGNVQPHAHFVCECCGRVLDIHEDFFPPESLAKLSAATGFTVRSAAVLFRGRCPQCQQEKLPPQ